MSGFPFTQFGRFSFLFGPVSLAFLTICFCFLFARQKGVFPSFSDSQIYILGYNRKKGSRKRDMGGETEGKRQKGRDREQDMGEKMEGKRQRGTDTGEETKGKRQEERDNIKDRDGKT
jgi:hypothetical protein